MPGLIGKKIGMTRIVDEAGRMIPVTVVQCEPGKVIQIKTMDKDGYEAIVVGAMPLSRPTKNRKYRFVRDFRVSDIASYEVGQDLGVELTQEGVTVKLTSTSKGKGFQGVIKRHNFSRGPETHGSNHHRRPGSIGACAMPGRVHKGKKLPGHMGDMQVSIKNVPVVLVDTEKSLIAVKGPVPGPINSMIKVTLES